MKAKPIKTLVYYDGPQLVLFETDLGHNMIAVAVERDGMVIPFFCCSVRQSHWEAYLNGCSLDLYALFKQALWGEYYFFDWWDDSIDGEVDLIEATPEEANNKEFWPGRGFFASAHD